MCNQSTQELHMDLKMTSSWKSTPTLLIAVRAGSQAASRSCTNSWMLLEITLQKREKKKKKKKAYKGWKQGQVGLGGIQKHSEHSRVKWGKPKPKLHFRCPGIPKTTRRATIRTLLTKQGKCGPIGHKIGDMVIQDTKKNEVLNAFFASAFTSRINLQESHGPEQKRKA